MHYKIIFRPFSPKKSDFRQKTSHIHQIWTFECKIRPFLDLFSQYSHILDSLEKLTILELFGDRGKRPCFQWSFWPFHRITDYIILYSLLVIISSHFCEIPTFEFKNRPISDLFSSKTRIQNIQTIWEYWEGTLILEVFFNFSRCYRLCSYIIQFYSEWSS